MDVVLIFNGAGNQMSQYAFYTEKKMRSSNCRAIYYRSNDDHYGYELERMFGIRMQQSFIDRALIKIFKILCCKPNSKISRTLGKLGFRIIYEDRDYSFKRENILRGPNGVNFYWGGWHSEKNFLEVESEVREKYTFLESTDDEDYNYFVNLIKKDNNSVSVHIRRGDYIGIPETSYYQFGGVATTSYYEAARDFFIKRYPQANFYFFSDDINWCKAHFKSDNFFFVDCNAKENSWRDMRLMSLCKNHIIANSTFSWWGAWLSKRNGITIRPKDFIKDVQTIDFYPESWIQIDY